MANPEVRKTLTSAQTLRSENISVAIDEREMLSPTKTSKSRKATPMTQSQSSYGKGMFGRER